MKATTVTEEFWFFKRALRPNVKDYYKISISSLIEIG
jgi:hypothetical protein